MKPVDVALAALTTARLTRLVITDDIGVYVRRPLNRLADQQDVEDWVRDGIECPWCIGFWIGAGVLATHPLWRRSGIARLAAGALALNYVVAHVAVRLGDFDIDGDHNHEMGQ